MTSERMNTMTKHLLCTASLLLGASCANAPHGSPEYKTLQHVYYHRTGGIAGVDDRVEIQPDGLVGVIRRNERPREFPLTRDQVTLLREQLRDFGKWESHYPRPPRAADNFEYELRYGGRTIHASDANPNVPDGLRAAWQSLDAIALQGE
jgi:hypothetical protein